MTGTVFSNLNFDDNLLFVRMPENTLMKADLLVSICHYLQIIENS